MKLENRETMTDKLMAGYEAKMAFCVSILKEADMPAQRLRWCVYSPKACLGVSVLNAVLGNKRHFTDFARSAVFGYSTAAKVAEHWNKTVAANGLIVDCMVQVMLQADVAMHELQNAAEMHEWLRDNRTKE